MSFHIIASSSALVALSHMLWNRKWEKKFFFFQESQVTDVILSTTKIVAHKSLILLIDFHTFWTIFMCVAILVSNVSTMHAHLTMRFGSGLQYKKSFLSNISDIFVSAQTCMVRRTPLLMSCFGMFFTNIPVLSLYSINDRLNFLSTSDGCWALSRFSQSIELREIGSIRGTLAEYRTCDLFLAYFWLTMPTEGCCVYKTDRR